MNSITYGVSEVRDRYIVRYTADVELTNDAAFLHVEVTSLARASITSSDFVRSAVEGIRRGAAKALKPFGRGAAIRLHELVIHPTDFSELAYEIHTAAQLSQALTEQLTSRCS